ncbi:hypothetical protein RJ641_005916, partial [Dillenia turbinata]
FSIAAINDTDIRSQWEPLAPTKEAQEFHLSQTYHEGLTKLQAKEYEKARELLESVLKDPLMSTSQVDSNASDGHLLQLRFLALKNLAAVFLQQGSSHYENALNCYLQAVEIDTKDSVVWNQLGTLSCSMGLLRNCMEKLLEVLIAIGDEVACLSVAELILRHWPSHSRALHVKRTIEDAEPVPFAPRGIDKLEPKHVRLKFCGKRRSSEGNIEDGVPLKRLKLNAELHLAEASWAALSDAILEILRPLAGNGPEQGAEKSCRSGDIRLIINLPSSSKNVMGFQERKEFNNAPDGENSSIDNCNLEKTNGSREKEATTFEDQPHERRSTRLETLRSRKPGKEESDFATSKDLAKVVSQFLEPFILVGSGVEDSECADTCSLPGSGISVSPSNTEYNDVKRFVEETSNNNGAYHIAHLLLENFASKCLPNRVTFIKFLELEKLTRHWGLDRSPECSLFLAELYHDFGLCSSSSSEMSDFVSESSYHLCKIIESVALDYPFHLSGGSEIGNQSLTSASQSTSNLLVDNSIRNSQLENSILVKKSSFWVRFYWLSAQLSIVEGNNAKAHEELCVALILLTHKKDTDGPVGSVCLPHCKLIKELTVDRVLHEINLLKIDYLMQRSVSKMIEKNMYIECINLLRPLLFSTKDVVLDALSFSKGDGEGVKSVEISALDTIIKACQKTKPMDSELYLNCHRKKLQILAVAAGMEECLDSDKPFHKKSRSKTIVSETESKESTTKHWSSLVEEVKAVAYCVSQVKACIDQNGQPSDTNIFMGIIGDFQSLLLAIMCNIANHNLYKKSSGLATLDETECRQRCCFIGAAIAFCKLQHLNASVSIKNQVDLIVAIHDLLAEYEMCCAGEGVKGEEGTFLKFAIKHLLALDMKLKSNLHSSNKGQQINHEQLSQDNLIKISPNGLKLDLNVEIGETEIVETKTVERNTLEGRTLQEISSLESPRKNNEVDSGKVDSDGSDKKPMQVEKAGGELLESGIELTEDERDELVMAIDNALDQCFYCLYGLNLRSDSSYEDDLVLHKNSCRVDYQTKEQCADVFQYILPYAKASSKTGLTKLRRVLRTIRKHYPHPPEDVLAENVIDKFLDDPNLCEDKLSEEAGTHGFLDLIKKMAFTNVGGFKHLKAQSAASSEPYVEVYSNLYYYLAQSEEMSATDKWPGFVLTKEGEEFVEQNARLYKYDLLFNPLRFESWQKLANIYDEEVDLLLNDGSKHINVMGWRKSASLPQRVETSRRRSRRCLLMSLALAKTSMQQSEIHELLALVCYDSLQNVVPFYDQRLVLPPKDAVWRTFCQNSKRHFEKAFAHKEDWSHAFYLGKLCEKLGYSPETSFSYYDKAITLNPTAVDPVYRMHASRLKLLYRGGKRNLEALKVVAAYSFTQLTKETVMELLGKLSPEILHSPVDIRNKPQASSEECRHVESHHLEEAWNVLYSDCLSGLEVCVEGDLKHFHKARYMLSKGLYLRGDSERAKNELSFCFKSSRSSFTVNMWEIDGMVKKGRRKTPGSSGNKRALEVNLPESSRKFITCIRKYMLFYLKLLEETGDLCTLDRAYISLRADKRFSLCLEDLVPVALGRIVKALMSSMQEAGRSGPSSTSSLEQQLEKMFSLFMEQGSLWPDLCSLPDIKSPELSESSLYGYLHRYIHLLEKNSRTETLEGINERIRKRFKNPKLSNSNCAKVCKHASVAWFRSLVISLASITPLQPEVPLDAQPLNPSDNTMEKNQLLRVDLQTNELWNYSLEDPMLLKDLETKWTPLLSKLKNVIVKKVLEENMEAANTLLKCSYNFYRDSSCITLPSAINLYLVPSGLTMEAQCLPGIGGVEALELSIPRKLLLWAYTLLHGRCANILAVVKHCEENAKSKMKKTASAPSNTSNATATPQTEL